MTRVRRPHTLVRASGTDKEIRMSNHKTQRQERLSLGALVISIVLTNLAFFLYVAPMG